jgi:hypothetical protein
MTGPIERTNEYAWIGLVMLVMVASLAFLAGYLVGAA